MDAPETHVEQHKSGHKILAHVVYRDLSTST